MPEHIGPTHDRLWKSPEALGRFPHPRQIAIRPARQSIDRIADHHDRQQDADDQGYRRGQPRPPVVNKVHQPPDQQADDAEGNQKARISLRCIGIFLLETSQ
jgi:hypothetical protein